MKLRAVLLVALLASTVNQIFAQITNPKDLLGKDNAITTAVPFLAITPDARSAALGDAGVATAPDGNSAYWNPAKLVFIDKKRGGSVSYTPWLGKIVNDMWIGYLSGFLKINQEQAIGASLKYFDLGDITFTNGPDPKDIVNTFNPREFALDVTYSRQLSETFSLGGSARFIHSNLTGAFTASSGNDIKPGMSVAADIGVYYTKPFEKSAKGSTLSLGATITNIGSKLSYTNGENRDFIPTTIRVGSAFTTNMDPYNTITFTVDFSKLMVPTQPIYDENGDIAYGVDPDRPLLSGMFGSFTDAPNGFKEEIQEVMTSVGIEYWYNKVFAGRLGYFNEAKTKGNRKYMTIGLGFRKERFGFDAAYLVPTNKREHPLAETIRFTLLFQVDQTTIEREESVTD